MVMLVVPPAPPHVEARRELDRFGMLRRLPPTDDERAALRARRVWLNICVRRVKSMRDAIPSLGSSRPLREWRSAHQSRFNRELRRYAKELAAIADRIGPPPKFFKPRPGKACDARIRRQYDPNRVWPSAPAPEPYDTHVAAWVRFQDEEREAATWRECTNPAMYPSERASRVCCGCGKAKSPGLVVCWTCFKHRTDTTPFKYWQSDLWSWVAQLPK